MAANPDEPAIGLWRSLRKRPRPPGAATGDTAYTAHVETDSESPCRPNLRLIGSYALHPARRRQAGPRIVSGVTDFRSETVQAKIRDAELMKVNHIVVIGDKEEKAKTLAVRERGAKPKFGITKEDFVSSLKKEISHKNL